MRRRPRIRIRAWMTRGALIMNIRPLKTTCVWVFVPPPLRPVDRTVVRIRRRSSIITNATPRCSPEKASSISRRL